MSSETERWYFYGLWLLVALSSQLRNYLLLLFYFPPSHPHPLPPS